MILNCPEKWWRLFGFATTLYQQARGLPVGSPLPVGHIQPYTSYIIAEADLSALGTMASEPEARSKQKNLQVLEQGRTIAAFPITPGSPQHPAPAGLSARSPGPGIVTTKGFSVAASGRMIFTIFPRDRTARSVFSGRASIGPELAFTDHRFRKRLGALAATVAFV